MSALTGEGLRFAFQDLIQEIMLRKKQNQEIMDTNRKNVEK
jgi:hypothetical protein